KKEDELIEKMNNELEELKESKNGCLPKSPCLKRCVETPCQNTYITFDALTPYKEPSPYSALRWNNVPVEIGAVEPPQTPGPVSACGNGKLEAGEECEVGTCLQQGLSCVNCKIRPAKPGPGRGNVRIYEVYTYQEEEIEELTTPTKKQVEGAESEETVQLSKVLGIIAGQENLAADYKFYELQNKRRKRAETLVAEKNGAITGAVVTDLSESTETEALKSQLKTETKTNTKQTKEMTISADRVSNRESSSVKSSMLHQTSLSQEKQENTAIDSVSAMQPETSVQSAAAEPRMTEITPEISASTARKKGIMRDHELGELHSIDLIAMYEEQELPAGTIFAYVRYVQDLRAQQEAINEKMKEASATVSSIFDIINNNLFGLEVSPEFDTPYEARNIINQKIEDVKDYFYFGEGFFKDLDLLIDYSKDLKIMQEIQDGLQTLAEFVSDNYPLSRSQMEAAQKKYQELSAALEEVKSRLPSRDTFEYAVDVPIKEESLPEQEQAPAAEEAPTPEEETPEEKKPEEEQPQKDKSEEYFQRGYTAYERGSYGEAVGWLAKSLKENPQKAEAMWVMAKALEKKGEFALASKVIQPIAQIKEWKKKIQPYAGEELKEIEEKKKQGALAQKEAKKEAVGEEKKPEEKAKSPEEEAYALLAQKTQEKITPEEKVISETEYVLFDVCVKNNQEFLYEGEKYKFLHIVQKNGAEYSAKVIRSKDSAVRELPIKEFRDKLYEEGLCKTEAKEEKKPQTFGREPREKETSGNKQPHTTIGPDGKEYVCYPEGAALPVTEQPTAIKTEIAQTRLTQRIAEEVQGNQEATRTEIKNKPLTTITGRVIDAGAEEKEASVKQEMIRTSLTTPQADTGHATTVMIGGEMCVPSSELPQDLLESIKLGEPTPAVLPESVQPEQEPIQRIDWLAKRKVELYELTHDVTVPVYSGAAEEDEKASGTLHKLKGDSRVKNVARLYVGKDIRRVGELTKDLDDTEWEKLKEVNETEGPLCTFNTTSLKSFENPNANGTIVNGVSCQNKDSCVINEEGKIVCSEIFSMTCQPPRDSQGKTTGTCVSDFDKAGCYMDAENNPICPGYEKGECRVEDNDVICEQGMMGGCTFTTGDAGTEVSCEGFDSCQMKNGEIDCKNEAEKIPPGCSEEDGTVDCTGYLPGSCSLEGEEGEEEVMCAESGRIPEGCTQVGDTFECEEGYNIPEECKIVEGKWDCGNDLHCGFGEEGIECWAEPDYDVNTPENCAVEEGEGGVNMICGEGIGDISKWPPGCIYDNIKKKFVCPEAMDIPSDCTLKVTGIECPDRIGYCGFDKDRKVVCVKETETTFYEGYNYENGRLSKEGFSSDNCGFKDGKPYCEEGSRKDAPEGCTISEMQMICNGVPYRLPDGLSVKGGKVVDEDGNQCFIINNVWRCSNE
ncbi:hypothetical protein DRJ25_03865, partial [Candidatus Woesearchaeota archaeon]